MRDPFDTGPVLRLGEVKAVAPEPEVPALVTASVENARPYSFDDVSISIGGMELTPAKDQDILIAVDDRIDAVSEAFGIPRSFIDGSRTNALTDAEFAAFIGNARHETLPKHRLPLDLFTAAFAPPAVPEVISEFEHARRNSLSVPIRIDHGDTSPEALRANHAAIVVRKSPNEIIPPPPNCRYVVRNGQVGIEPLLKFEDGDES